MSADLAATAANRYWASIRGAATKALGHEPGAGTTIVPTADRAGSNLAVAYPANEFTLIWCSPHLAPTLAPLESTHPLSATDFVATCVRLGGTHLADGNHRVLTRPASMVEGANPVALSRDQTEDVELIRLLLEQCSDEDADEAEFELNDLDPAIMAILTEERRIASLASARPWSLGPEFDDIGVLTHPDHRGMGLGAAVVAALARHQQDQGRLMFYSCDVTNEGSNRLAQRVGFELVATVAGVSFEGRPGSATPGAGGP